MALFADRPARDGLGGAAVTPQPAAPIAIFVNQEGGTALACWTVWQLLARGPGWWWTTVGLQGLS